VQVQDVTGPNTGDWLKSALLKWGISSLTDIQKKALGAGIADGVSLVVSAPTSSGKTLIAEIAILSAIHRGMRVLYLVSHKALADQKFLDFKAKFEETEDQSLATVGLSTGDRTEGDVDAQVRVATYEKALGLFLTGQISPSNTLVVADELQILGEPGRGPDIETLCAALRQRSVRQFLTLTATVENPEDLAGWMECSLVTSSERGTPLHQEIWSEDRIYKITFGDEDGHEIKRASGQIDLTGVLTQILSEGKGPVLVFTESKREANNFASDFARIRVRGLVGIALAEQLELFSEPTDSSDRLRSNAERAVAFHTADLSSQERQVLEQGFAERKFDVCFATSTLAAGVNFPFQTIVFPKLTYQWRDNGGGYLGIGEYRNMSGRAGRLGLHEQGYAILLAKNPMERAHATKLVSPINQRLKSEFLSLSLRKTILSLIASNLANNLIGIDEFFKNTLFWYQTLDRNPKRLDSLNALSAEAVAWLAKYELISNDDDVLRVTAFGKATALSGLLPDTAVEFGNMLKAMTPAIQEAFDDYADGFIYACCSSKEFCAEKPMRGFPWAYSDSVNASDFWQMRRMPVKFDRNNPKLAQCAQAMALYSRGEIERKIARATGLSAGDLHRLSIDVSWVMDGLHRISTVPSIGCSQALSNKIGSLARQVRWGVPPSALDILRVSERDRVPGMGRQRAMALVSQGLTTLQDVVTAGPKKLFEILRNSIRAEALIESVIKTVGHSVNSMEKAHIRVAASFGLDVIVADCYLKTGTEYEIAIVDLLKATPGFMVLVIDDGKRQNVPDFSLKVEDAEALIECKTAIKKPALINKEDAWAVIQKSADFATHARRVTLGKPEFDETSKVKSANAVDITLVENGVFIEAVLRIHAKQMTPADLMKWLIEPGFAEIERLPGKPTYSL